MADRSSLRADCALCFGLCCVAHTLVRSADFAIDKPAGTPCLHLADDHSCAIHTELRARGFPGCTTYDCFGAGQRVAQHTFAGVSWREAPERTAQMIGVFEAMRVLHELLWYVDEAVALASGDLRDELAAVRETTERLTREDAASLASLDVEAHRASAVPALRAASRIARAGLDGRDLSGADLAGGRLAGADLRGADLRGALLIGADLGEADLRLADVTGADLRGARVHGARLETTLFLTRVQVAGARGDDRTTLPEGLERPAHWTAGP